MDVNSDGVSPLACLHYFKYAPESGDMEGSGVESEEQYPLRLVRARHFLVEKAVEIGLLVGIMKS